VRREKKRDRIRYEASVLYPVRHAVLAIILYAFTLDPWCIFTGLRTCVRVTRRPVAVDWRAAVAAATAG